MPWKKERMGLCVCVCVLVEERNIVAMSHDF